MKRYMIAFLVLLLLACNARKVGEAMSIENDALYFLLPIQHPNIIAENGYCFQKDIKLDSIEIKRKDLCTSISVKVPKLTPENAKAYVWIDSMRNEKFRDFRQKHDVDTCDEYGYEVFWLHPVHLYQSKNLLSYVFENGRAVFGSSAGFDYQAVNFDISKQKDIEFEDYFRIETHEDSVFLGQIIYRSIDEKPHKGHGYDFAIPGIFSFDNDYVYFYFGRYDMIGWGGDIGKVPKKLLSKYIKAEYQ